MSRGQFIRKWHRLDARLIKLIGESKSPDEVAADLGVTRNAAIQRATTLRQRGVPVPAFVKPPRRRKPRVEAPNVIPLVERALAADPAGVRPERCGRSAWPLHVAAYIAHVELGHTQLAAGRLIGREGTLVRYAVRQIEERRDDPAFDAFMERLGEQAREMVA